MRDLTLNKAEKKRLKRLNALSTMLVRGLRDDAVMSITHCSIEDIFDARKLFNRESTPETKRKSRLDTLVILESRGDLTEFHLYAAEEICTARRFITSEVRCRISSVEIRVDTFGNKAPETESEYSVRVQQQYKLWRVACQNSRVDINACIYMIENQVTLKESDKRLGRRYGYTKMHLVRGLGMYCSLFRPVRKK